jgi:hypothetical protein
MANQLSPSAAIAAFVLAAGSLVLGGCDKGQQQEASSGASAGQGSSASTTGKNEDQDLVVAKVGDEAITVGELSDELNRQNPYVRMRFTSPERKRDFLKNMVRFEVLAQEAEKRNLQRDPEVIRRCKRVMIDRLMEKLRESLVKPEDITDAAVEKYYEENIKLYKQKVMAKAKKKPGDPRHFTELVKEHSIDPKTKVRGGDLEFFTRDTDEIPEPVVKAAFETPGIWQLAGPVKTEQGWVVLLKTGKREGFHRPLEMEKGRIKNRLYNQRRLKAVEEYVEKLQKKTKVEVNDKNLEKVKIDVAREERPPSKRPPPGRAH